MSREQGLITKKCVATHTNYFLKFKIALYSSALVMKFLTTEKIITVKLKASFLLNAMLHMCLLNFIRCS